MRHGDQNQETQAQIASIRQSRQEARHKQESIGNLVSTYRKAKYALKNDDGSLKYLGRHIDGWCNDLRNGLEEMPQSTLDDYMIMRGTNLEKCIEELSDIASHVADTANARRPFERHEKRTGTRLFTSRVSEEAVGRS